MYSKVSYNGNTIIDISNDTVTPGSVLSGYTAHDSNGESITGIGSSAPCGCGVYGNGVPIKGSCAGLFFQQSRFDSPVSIGKYVVTCHNMFYGCKNFNHPVLIPDTVKDCSYMFSSCDNFDSDVIIGNGVTNCYSMFSYCSYFNRQLIISGSVEDCGYMFRNCTNFNSQIIIKDGVKNCRGMFSGCVNMKAGPVYIPNSVEDCSDMFDNCSSYGDSTGIYINNINLSRENVRGIVHNKNNSYRLNIYCNNLFILNGTIASNSIVNATISWLSTTNGYYNSVYNIYIFNNYSGT